MKRLFLLLPLLLMPLVHLGQGNANIQYATIGKQPGISRTWQPAWNVFIADAIDHHGSILLQNDSLPKAQIMALCPQFFTATNDQKKAFWVLVFAGMIRYESGFDPKNRYLESNGIYSEGLLQLSYGDERGHRAMTIKKSLNNILDPKANLESGVAVLADQIRTKHILFTQTHYYWSVLTKRQREISAFFAANSGNLSFCTAASPVPVSIYHKVPFISQPTNYACWSSSIAMILFWKENTSSVLAERGWLAATVVNNSNVFANYFRQGLQADNQEPFKVWNFETLAPQSFSLEGLADLVRASPIWVAWDGCYNPLNTTNRPCGHVVVIVGMESDGTLEGTQLIYHDPDAGTGTYPNRGLRDQRISYTDFEERLLRRVELLERSGINVTRNQVNFIAYPR